MAYTVDQVLYDQALAAIFAKRRPLYKHLSDDYVREGAKKSLNNAVWHAFDFHNRHGLPHTTQESGRSKLLDRTDLPASVRARIEESDHKIAASSREMDGMLVAAHRRALIGYLTLDKLVDQALAEQIVDKCILGKVQA